MPSDGFPYPVFVYSALVPWTFFANAITSSSNSLVGSAHLVSKVYFPRLIIPLSAVGVGIVDFAVASSILLAMMLFYGVGWSLNLLMAPVLLLAIVFTALGVGTCLSALTVSYRDFRYVVPFMVQIVDVRDAGRLSGEPRADAVAMASLSQPDVGIDRGLPCSVSGEGVRFLRACNFCRYGDEPVYRRRCLFRAS